jgi:chlorite dismutase
MISDSVERMQVLTSKLYSTLVGKYIEPSHVYLSCLRASIYSTNKVVPGFVISEKPMKYVVVYPFIKAREWYLLAFEDRKKLMEEHIAVGRKFPQVRLNTSYSFGINDQDFMLAFEVDDLIVFQDLIVQLRETRLSKYVIKDTPMMVCVHKDAENIIRSIG